MRLNLQLASMAMLLLTAAGLSRAAVALPNIFADHMVLQRDMKVPIWGSATPGEKVTVRFFGQSAIANANQRGQWMVQLAPMAASAKVHTMRILAGHSMIKLRDVLVGDVWLCSGQSNMEYPLHGWFRGGNGRHAVAHANYPLIRMINLPSVAAARPQHNFPVANPILGKWNVCTPKTAQSFSAVGYFFGRDLQKQIHVPIGLIQSAWGGTRIQPWLPAVAYRQTPSLKKEWLWLKGAEARYPTYQRQLMGYMKMVRGWLKTAGAQAHAGQYISDPIRPPQDPVAGSKQNPTVIFNGRIAPLIPYALRGVLWYQGENNVGNGSRFYYGHLAALISSWRQLWHRRAMPFLLVQIAPFDYAQYSGNHLQEPKIWQAEQWAAQRLPDCGIVSTMDANSPDQGHPVNKRPVGYRLCQLALSMVYHVKGIHACSPMFQSMRLDGAFAIIHFSHVDGALMSRNGKALNWFQIAGADGRFVIAKAKIHGSSVWVHAANVRHPIAVRFGWYDTAMPNLVSKSGLPAMPFQTFEKSKAAD